jgi:anaerobic magnesium-protoporphyrin IX monomethyl ester cyclase
MKTVDQNSISSELNLGMKVMLVIPPRPEYQGLVQPVYPHLGVAYLVAILKRYKVAVKIVDMMLGYSYKQLYKFIDQFAPNMIGVTSYSYGYNSSYETIDRIKSHGNHITVIGGPHVSAVRGKVLAETKADFAVKGEGEYTLVDLCKTLRDQAENYEEIKGLIWRKGDEIIENEDRPFLKGQELDDMSFPAFEEFELNKYACFKENRLQITTSRGCPYQCIFCSVRLSMGNRFRSRSPENVVDEIEYWYKKGWKRFEFNDDCFSVDVNRAIKICNLIIERKLKIKYYLFNGLRVDRVNKVLLQKLKDSGCEFISYGVESGNDEVLKTIKKGITIKQVEEAVRITNEIGITNSGTFIIGHPSETLDKAMDTLRLAKKLPFSFVSFCNLVPYPGTELSKWIKSHGTLLYDQETYLNRLSYGEKIPIFETKEFNRKEREKVLRLGFYLHWRTITKTKLGPVMGYLAYSLIKNDAIRKILGKILTKYEIGDKIFRFRF